MAFSFNELKKNLNKDPSGLKPLNIALLGDSSTQFLAQALAGYGYEVGFDLKVSEAGYGHIDALAAGAPCEFLKRKFDFVVLALSAEKLLEKFYKLDPRGKRGFCEAQAGRIREMYASIVRESPSVRVILYNFVEIDDAVYGSFANKTDSSFLFQLRALNVELMKLGRLYSNLFICDISSLQNQVGRGAVCDQRTYVAADMAFSLDFVPLAAKRTLDIVLAVSGVIKKVLITDLDNTLWGGVVGDDGVENIRIGGLGDGKAFSEMQAWVLELKKRGVLVAVCSKNSEQAAKEPFEKHPDMILSLEDIAVFSANWGNKPDNIRGIQAILNVDFDSMVFIDDDPAERELVRSHFSRISVPDIPEDPAERLPFLRGLNLFETASLSEADIQRTKLLQQAAARAEARAVSAVGEAAFLAGLEMTAEISPFTSFNTPRVAQLTQRANQFNLRTRRYTEDEIRTVAGSARYRHFALSLIDKFGAYGLICAVVLEKKDDARRSLFIDSWLMSCRVFNRGVEDLALNTMVRFARENASELLVGEYLPTGKNAAVKDLYRRLGFEQAGGVWQLDVRAFRDRPHFIRVAPGGPSL